MRLPVGNWVDLAVLRSGDWVRYRPRPVRIVAIAFGVYLEPRASPGFQLERRIPLRPGEYLRGAVANGCCVSMNPQIENVTTTDR